jgi:hypothetical protein
MKIVIDINEHIYEQIMADSEVYVLDNEADRILIENAIYNGTPLPEHHGRLIDADELRRTMEKDVRKAMSFVDLTDFVWLAPTIIEGSDSECQG